MPEIPKAFQELCARAQAEGEIYWVSPDNLGIFDPEAAEAAHRANFEGLAFPPRPGDLLFGKSAPPVYWTDVRAALSGRMRSLCAPEPLAALYERMLAEAGRNAGQVQDLTLWTHKTISRALLPALIETRNNAALRAIHRDQDLKIANIVKPAGLARSRVGRFKSFAVQAGAGLAIRRVLRSRLSGAAPEAHDVAQAALGLRETLGLDRAAYLVGTFLSAIAGPPGSNASCLLFELFAHPEWRHRVEEECRRLSVAELCAAPLRAAPITHDFVREVLRRWGFPPVAARAVRRPFRLAGIDLDVGQTYLHSAFVMHHDPSSWDDPERFDPARWARGDCPRRGGAYAPFGLAPRGCMGASLGLAQLVLFCHLITVTLAIEPVDVDEADIHFGGAFMPTDFRGTVKLRA